MNPNATDRFRADCPYCSAPLEGRLVTQKSLTPDDVVELLGDIVTVRTVCDWIRTGWVPDGTLPNIRHPLVDTRDLLVGLAASKRQGSQPQPSKDPESDIGALQTRCPACDEPLGGVIAAVYFVTSADVIADHGAWLRPATLRDWVRAGRVRGFKLAGVRGWVFEEGEFTADVEAMKQERRQRVPFAGATSAASESAPEMRSHARPSRTATTLASTPGDQQRGESDEALTTDTAPRSRTKAPSRRNNFRNAA